MYHFLGHCGCFFRDKVDGNEQQLVLGLAD